MGVLWRACEARSDIPQFPDSTPDVCPDEIDDMKTIPTTRLAERLSALALDFHSGRISQGDYQSMAEPIRAELRRRLAKSEREAA
jgi:hypothetical protein